MTAPWAAFSPSVARSCRAGSRECARGTSASYRRRSSGHASSPYSPTSSATAEIARRRWRLVLASIAFAACAPVTLVGLPFAFLTLAARPRAPLQWATALVVGLPSPALLAAGGHDLLAGLGRPYAVIVSAAF